MGGRWGWRRWIVTASLAVTGVATAQGTRVPTLQAMHGVTPGRWELRMAGSTVPPRVSCVADPAILLRLHHRAATCSRFVIDDSAKGATVHYTCPGAGHVRSRLRIDTPRVLFIESEGIADGMPFSDAIEARRLGSC